jgi:type 1 glutamine amidotransferase
MAAAVAVQAQTPLKVLFWGGPGGGAHNPTALSDTLAPYFAANNVAMTYRSAAAPVWLHPDTLKQYDVMLVYTTNQVGNDLSATQLTNLYNWIDSGRVIVALHGATNTFLNGTNAFRGVTTTVGWRQLLGAQFVDHAANNTSGTITFKTPRHPALDSASPLPAAAASTGGAPFWDEGRRHGQFVADTVVIARARINAAPDSAVPWIWVRPQGKGFVYYNASGHDGQVWKQAEFKGQVLRALRWGAKVGSPTGLRGQAAIRQLIRLQGTQLLVPAGEAHSVRVQDLSGREVFRKGRSLENRHDLSGLPLGYYSIEVLTRKDVFRALYVQNVQTP